MKNIIAIQGYKASGKDETAKFLNYILNTPMWMHYYWIGKLINFTPIVHTWKITRYAESLKKMLAIMINVDVKRFEDREFKEFFYFNFNTYELLDNRVDKIDNAITDKVFNRLLKHEKLNIATRYTLSIRQILQFFGTDIMRRFFGNELWIHTTLNSKNNNLIIADQRFIIENKTVSESKYQTTITHIIRDGCTAGLHSSEKEIEVLYKNLKYDVLLKNNGTLKDLFNECKSLIYNYIL